jgi:general secretion pathway protein L
LVLVLSEHETRDTGFAMTHVLSTPRDTLLTRDAAKAPNSAAMLKTSALRQAGMLQQSEGFFDTVAGLIVRLIDRIVSPRTICLREDQRGTLVAYGTAGSTHTIDTPDANARETRGSSINAGDESNPAGTMEQFAGSRVELMISPDRCLFCPLDLPQRAAEFLNGIVRAQIDRLTPWHASEVAFGCSAPVEIEGERLSVTIAAAPLTSIKPLLNNLFAKGARSVAVSVAAPEPDRPPIKIWEQRALDALQAGRIRKLLVTVLALTAILAGGGLAAAAICRTYLADDYDRLDQETRRLRAIVSGQAAFGSDAGAQRALVQRKLSAPSTVLTIETLSKLLPDHTHVIELRLEDNKLRLIGQTRDAASLIGLIEQGGQFRRATFFAPTTRSASEAGERFHIEATVQPLSAAPRS